MASSQTRLSPPAITRAVPRGMEPKASCQTPRPHRVRQTTPKAVKPNQCQTCLLISIQGEICPPGPRNPCLETKRELGVLGHHHGHPWTRSSCKAATSVLLLTMGIEMGMKPALGSWPLTPSQRQVDLRPRGQDCARFRALVDDPARRALSASAPAHSTDLAVSAPKPFPCPGQRATGKPRDPALRRAAWSTCDAPRVRLRYSPRDLVNAFVWRVHDDDALVDDHPTFPRQHRIVERRSVRERVSSPVVDGQRKHVSLRNGQARRHRGTRCIVCGGHRDLKGSDVPFGVVDDRMLAIHLLKLLALGQLDFPGELLCIRRPLDRRKRHYAVEDRQRVLRPSGRGCAGENGNYERSNHCMKALSHEGRIQGWREALSTSKARPTVICSRPFPSKVPHSGRTARPHRAARRAVALSVMSSIQEFHPQGSDETRPTCDYEQIERRSDQCHRKQGDRNIVSPDGEAGRNDDNDRYDDSLDSVECFGAWILIQRVHQ